MIMQFRSRSAPLIAAIAIVVSVAGLTACSGSSAANLTSATSVAIPVSAHATPTMPATVTDVTGKTITVTSADRIVSLAGGVTETLFAMGLGDRIVGRDISSEVSEAASIPLVTTAHDASVEGVLSTHPTVVIGDERSGPPEALAGIRKAGVPVVIVPEVTDLAGAAKRVRMIATAVGSVSAGDQVLAAQAASIAKVRERTKSGQPLTVAFLYLRGTSSIYLIGGKGSGADSLVEALGARDAGTIAGLGPFTPLTAEALVKSKPDVILVMTKGLESVGGIDGLLALPGVAATPAGRDRRVIAIDDGELLSFGPRTSITLEKLGDALWP